MAIRNVGRNKRRTMITVLTVVLGTVVVIQVRGLINGLQGEMIRNLTRKVNGDLQIHRDGYKDNLEANPFDYLIPFDQAEEMKIENTPGISAAAPRLRVFGLINNQRTQKTTPVFITGLDPVRELEVCPRIQTGVEEGSFLKPLALASATPPPTAAPAALEEAPELGDAVPAKSAPAPARRGSTLSHPVLLTPSLARGLKARIGDEMVILLKDANNMEQAIIANFSGTLEMNLPNAAAKMIWLDLATLQKSLAVERQASEIVIRMNENENLHALQKRLGSTMGAGLLVERWDEVSGFFTDVMGLQDAVFKVILAIMFVIVSSAIINTSMMTVSERVREIGTLMAIGYKRRHILMIFLVESTTIGLLGGISGVGLGFAGVFVMRHAGLPFSLPGTRVPFVIAPFVTLDFLLLVLVLACISALVAALYPSYRASRLSPVRALTSN